MTSMDSASRVLAEGVPSGVPRSYRALADHSGVPRSTLHYRAHGRQSVEAKGQSQQYLTPSEEKAVVDFLLHMSVLGCPVRIKHVPFIAFSATRHRSVPDRPSKPPGKNWTKALESRHPEIKARKVKALDWNRHEKNTRSKITHWFEVIGKVIQDPHILAENVYNMDETGVMLSMLGSVKVLVGKDDTRDYRGARVKRTTVTAVECISADGRYLNPMVIWPATTHRSNWTTFPTPGWYYACSESGYTDSRISFEWLKRVFDPQTKERANHKPRVLICDGFGAHETLEILEYCFANNIILCRLPSHTSDKLQPCDVAVFASLKAAYRDNVERMERGGVNTIGKQHFTCLYSPARERAFTKRNILAGWSKTGLFPFNPDRVLKDLPEVSSAPMNAGGTTAEPTLHEPRSTMPMRLVTPVTPVTPTSVDALMSLQNLIVKHDAQTLDPGGKHRLFRHIEKLTKAARVFLSKNALQRDQIHFLLKMSNESKTRRSTKSLVLGKGKVMSYGDLKEARTERMKKNAAKANGKKTKRNRKRKNSVSRAGSPQSPAKMARMNEALEPATASDNASMTHATEDLPQPQRAPVARMW